MGRCQVPPGNPDLSVQSLSGGPDRPISLHRATQTHMDPSRGCSLLLSMYLRTRVPRFDSRSAAAETQANIVLCTYRFGSHQEVGISGRPQEDDYSNHQDRQALSDISPAKGGHNVVQHSTMARS